ncbi:MAG TPA: gamma-glutamyl-gamma-aminobutyrate hydrolase family protein [Vicinamibacterales bacterium]|nr:gamma-glutamyl-gamma-aminobutyrate hydrolase family protein [Vicinamibacterales bacterium]
MPRIAIVPCRALADYLEAVKRPGGEPVELDYQRDEPAEVVWRMAGVLLTGGGDVDPALYGETPHETYQPSEPGRDEYEIALVRAAIAAERPILAICRGMQVLNVALGGTLIQDIPSMVNGAQPHAVAEPRFAIAHEVWVAKGSQLATLMAEKLDGDICQVNSRHHQAVKTVAAGWEVTGTAPDGVVEAIEQQGSVFRMAVQWHPENFWRTGEFRPLFEAFVDAAREARGR